MIALYYIGDECGVARALFSLAERLPSLGQFRLFPSRLREETNGFHYFLLYQIPLFACPSFMWINLQYSVKRTNCFKIFFLMHECQALIVPRISESWDDIRYLCVHTSSGRLGICTFWKELFPCYTMHLRYLDRVSFPCTRDRVPRCIKRIRRIRLPYWTSRGHRA